MGNRQSFVLAGHDVARPLVVLPVLSASVGWCRYSLFLFQPFGIFQVDVQFRQPEQGMEGFWWVQGQGIKKLSAIQPL